jgi:predicted DNA-binding transcriptional regulator YafY
LQISRLFEIIYIVLEKGKVTARELAERFEVTPRTIYRDVESLAAAGIPVYMTKGRNGGLSLLPGFVLDKAVLTQGEKDEILSALAGLSALGRDEAGEALSKLASLFGESGCNWIEADFSGWGWTRGQKDSFSLLKEAILARRVLGFDYYGSKGRKTSRTVEPLKLIFRGQSWYLYAYCRMRGTDRFFKLSRMEKIVVQNESFSRKTPERVITREDGPEYEQITVRFRAFPPVSFRIYDEYPHHCISEEEGGSLLVETSIPKGEWLSGYFLGYGENIELLEPPELRDNLIRTIDKMRALYLKS